jgi:hypothetical protein
VDAQLFSELDTGVYEAVATLEYLGRSVTVAEIREATGLDAPVVGEILDALTEHGVLTRRRTDAGDAFELARRDWSATPEIRSHWPRPRSALWTDGGAEADEERTGSSRSTPGATVQNHRDQGVIMCRRW